MIMDILLMILVINKNKLKNINMVMENRILMMQEILKIKENIRDET